MSAIAQALPVIALPAIGQAFGGGFFSGVTVENGQRYLNIVFFGHLSQGGSDRDGNENEVNGFRK